MFLLKNYPFGEFFFFFKTIALIVTTDEVIRWAKSQFEKIDQYTEKNILLTFDTHIQKKKIVFKNIKWICGSQAALLNVKFLKS